ncbi:MAG: domain S-box protein [Flaviaesturariibacter sp.]|nr:domain S-box protein [Flaviaesturariibacter sp.]
MYAFFVFALTVAFGFFYPGYTITLSGILVIIFLSVFVESKSSTLIAGAVGASIVVGFMLWHSRESGLLRSWTELLFILLLIAFTTLIVLYIKTLMRHIEFDQSHMTSLFENATEGIVLTNGQGIIVLANPAILQMFRYTAEELIGQRVDVLLPTRYQHGHGKLREGFHRNPQNRQMGSGRDLNGQRKNGETFPVEVSLSAYRQQNEQYVIAFVVDITHRKEIEQSMLLQQQQLEAATQDVRKLNTELEAKVEERTLILKEALQRLEESQEELSEALDKERQLNEIKGRFVSMASHEFRTPLSAVLSSASLIGKYTKADQQANRDKHISRIKDSVKHLNDLLEDFLSLGKLDEGKVRTETTTFALPQLIHETIDEVRGLVKEGQSIDYQHEGPDTLVSDRRLVMNILINLISNAVKFSDANSVIQVHSEIGESAARISVIDRGIGIPEEDQQHLFTSFFRGRNALNIQGTGLGLHIVKRYADLLRGRLRLQSSLGQGTTITLYLPVNKQENAEIHPGH